MNILKKKIIVTFFLVSSTLFAQQNKIFLIDEHKKLIENFQVTIFYKNQLKTIKNNNYGYFFLPKIYDSIQINYDSFFEKKIPHKKFKKIDTIWLEKKIEMDEINITSHKTKFELGIKKARKKIFIENRLENIIRLEVNKYDNFLIKSVHFYLYKKMWDPINFKKYSYGNYNKIELILFASNNDNPNKKKVNLLKKPYIIEIKFNKKKGWQKINLKHLNLYIKNYKYLYVGFKTIANTIFIGDSNNNKDKGIASFIKAINFNDWQELKWHKTNTKPAIKITLVK